MLYHFKKISAHLLALGLLTSAPIAFSEVSNAVFDPDGEQSLTEFLDEFYNQLPVAIEKPIARFETVPIEISNTTFGDGLTISEGAPLKLVNLVTTHRNQIRLQTGNAGAMIISGV